MGRKLHTWDAWNPGLDTDDMTVKEVLDTLPAAEPEDVPAIIRKYENPESPDALPGAVSLLRHDCIHVLLGRGLHVQDEAFVIGATMGSASDFTQETQDFFIEISTTEYPRHWRFLESHIKAYKLGVGFSQEHLRNTNLHKIPLETPEWINKTVREVRKTLNISKPELRAYKRKEMLYIPGTPASLRLDSNPQRKDGTLLPD